MIGVHTPGYSFGRDRDTVARAVERLEIPFAVALDPDYRGLARVREQGLAGPLPVRPHREVGATCTTARASTRTPSARSARCLGIDVEPMAPLRPEDEPGVLLEPQTADIALPADRDRLELVRDWTDGEDWIAAADAGAAASFSYSAGAAYAVLSEGGVEPGLYEVDGTVEAESPGLRLHGVQFTPAPPAPS